MTSSGNRRPLLGLVGWALVTFVAAAIGGIGSADASRFYAELSLPGWAPPAWLFAPVWTALYSLMAISVWLVWNRAGMAGARAALTLFVVQLVVNSLWSWLFFAWHLGSGAFAEIVVLLVLVVATVVAFARIHRLAAVLLLPYLAWVGFATALTYAVWQRNPQLLG